MLIIINFCGLQCIQRWGNNAEEYRILVFTGMHGRLQGCSYVIFFKRRNDVKCYGISALNCVRT